MSQTHKDTKAEPNLSICKKNTRGLSLVPTCRYSYTPFGQIAQSVEQRTENPCVDSSILSLTTKGCSVTVAPLTLTQLV